MNKNIPLILISVLPLIYSCVSLNEVNQYATTSAAALNKINDVDYTFTTYCRQDCELQQLRSGSIDTLFKCNCEETAKRADEAIQKISTTITAYLIAIEQLSNNKSFTYNFSNLTTGLQQNPLLHLTDQQVGVYTKAGNFISTAVTAGYRKNKLKQYIEKADPLFQDLTETFIFLINNRLRAQLRIGYDIRLTNIRQMFGNVKNDKGLKQMIVKWYLDENDYYKMHDTIINSYVALLRSVQKGHHELYLHRNNLKAYDTKELIRNYQLDVQDIIASLKNQ
jgi:hypothetical protein